MRMGACSRDDMLHALYEAGQTDAEQPETDPTYTFEQEDSYAANFYFFHCRT